MSNQMIVFDEMACCAIRETFLINQEELAPLKTTVGEENYKILTDIFKRTVRMGTILKDIHLRFYYMSIKVELKRLSLLTSIFKLSCGHTVFEHINALEGLKNQIGQLTK